MTQRFYDKEPTQEFLCAGSLSDLNQTDFNFYPELNHETFLEIEFTSNVVTGFAGFNLTLTPRKSFLSPHIITKLNDWF